MKELRPARFEDFFGALYKNTDGQPLQPMNWQIELVQAACEGEWPEYICLPTGSGKTSTIGIAIFALACSGQFTSGKTDRSDADVLGRGPANRS
ncbi:MAG: hypothetical protein R3C56_20880 [Pirellulaceae bacterium]